LVVAAEQKPDFSGEYVLNPQASALGAGAAAVRSAVLRIEHREPMVPCQGAFTFDSTSFNYFRDSRQAWTREAVPSLTLTSGYTICYKTCRGGGTGRRTGLKILGSDRSVRVRFPPPALIH
jgi:hypothetical protein